MRTIYSLDSTLSTQDVARKLAREGAEHGSVVLTELQSEGRGRRGRTWHCPKGKGLLASIIWRMEEDRSRVQLLSLAAAMAVAEAITTTTGLEARTKWPNDVLVRGKKVGGILIESSPSSSQNSSDAFAIIGIGINVNFHLEEMFGGAEARPEALAQPATTLLDELGKEVDRLALLLTILLRFEYYSELLALRREKEMLAAWCKADLNFGRQVEVRVGEKVLQGVYEDIAGDGSLVLLRADGKRESIAAGEVKGVRRS